MSENGVIKNDYTIIKNLSVGKQLCFSSYYGLLDVGLHICRINSNTVEYKYVRGISSDTFFNIEYDSEVIIQWESSQIGSHETAIIKPSKIIDILVAGSIKVISKNYIFIILCFDLENVLHNLETFDVSSIKTCESFTLFKELIAILNIWRTEIAFLRYSSWIINKYLISLLTQVGTQLRFSNIFLLFINCAYPIILSTIIHFAVLPNTCDSVPLCVYDILDHKLVKLLNGRHLSAKYKVMKNAESLVNEVSVQNTIKISFINKNMFL